MDRTKGFTLLEVVIVTAIIAMLSALAASSYRHYVFRARRTEARHMLMSIAHGEERWYATYNRYTDDLSKFGYATAAVSPHANYEVVLTVEGNDAQGYAVAALPANSQIGDSCGVMTLDSTGAKTPDRSDRAANANGHCW
ncbi:type IV pilin protein [Dyella psychrodurans]|uniref:Prepilin-type N-terminal cleavage/methylation domain-containing protein n=1 Tax=Dyella psychrodurans TaxID=1927960 RepID=A0A370XEQ3_9GAMM|nr:type IV pilin protein [Dyella psychrodurans]RDS86849.1 prepilin-type N-terminal cleavage/methylation domain-containing protein [Dyella psychrodurans]